MKNYGGEIEESSGIAQKSSQILETFHSGDRVMNNKENACKDKCTNILEIGKTLSQFMGGGEKCDPKLVGGQLPGGGGAQKT